MLTVRQLEERVAASLGEERNFVRNVSRRLIDAGLLPESKPGRGGVGAARATFDHATLLILATAACGRLDRRGPIGAPSVTQMIAAAPLYSEGPVSLKTQTGEANIDFHLKRVPEADGWSSRFGALISACLEHGPAHNGITMTGVTIGRDNRAYGGHISYRNDQSGEDRLFVFSGHYGGHQGVGPHLQTWVTIPLTALEDIGAALRAE
ncbi:MAG: hypothetical protein ACYC1L_18520 [Alphaproteobacteria bacterium]